uniref:MATH domain-containing protein n=1 Tax=Brassica oleracea TaxID=3712 RepID=A0A3P6E191_BRAOL|nr:unnamed protein product [Brassica oleracea]
MKLGTTQPSKTSSIAVIDSPISSDKLFDRREYWRERPPSTYCLKISSFTKLATSPNTQKYDSLPFASDGYNWTLTVYPKGNKNEDGDGQVSLYVQIDNSTLLNSPKEVYPEVKRSWIGNHGQESMDMKSWTENHGQEIMDRKTEARKGNASWFPSLTKSLWSNLRESVDMKRIKSKSKDMKNLIDHEQEIMDMKSWTENHGHKMMDRKSWTGKLKQGKMIELLMVAQTETYVWSTETDAKRFFLFKPYWGQPRTKSYDEIANPGNGYLFDKSQILFGVDVLVTETFNKWEVFSFTENLHNRFYKWEITSFSSLEKQFYLSDEFTIGGRNW